MSNAIENAIIEAVSLGAESHGIMTAYVTLKMDGGGVSLGGYALDTYDKTQQKRVPTVAMGVFVHGVLDAVECSDWSKLVGKPCRVKFDGESMWGAQVIAIGHFIKDRWFEPREAFKDVQRTWEAKGVES